jgi:hypothetical protein
MKVRRRRNELQYQDRPGKRTEIHGGIAEGQAPSVEPANEQGNGLHGSKGLPVAMIALPSDQRMASSAVHSDLQVGLERGKTKLHDGGQIDVGDFE